MRDELYNTYESAFRALRGVAHDPGVSISSVASELDRLLASCSTETRQVVLLALGDALGCLPLKSRTHLARALNEGLNEVIDLPDRQTSPRVEERAKKRAKR